MARGNVIPVSIDWTPILSADGQHYCSPRCGSGKFCKKSWYDRAVREADALAIRMGDGWKPRVWENLGWHYSVSKGCTKITVDTTQEGPVRGYTAWIEPGAVIRQQTLQIIQSADTPEDALGFATQEARTVMSRLNEALAALNDVVDGEGQP